MDSREAALKALKEGKELYSTVTGIKYKLVNGQLFSRNCERAEWSESGLTFLNPASWLNLKS
jgi:hypothetical protein